MVLYLCESRNIDAPVMGNEARNYTRSTLKRVYGLSGNQCAAPDCGKMLIARDEISITSKICHIEAASNDGSRYNSLMTDKERKGSFR